LKFKPGILFFICLLHHCIINAQTGSIQGKVVDSKGIIIQHAKVHLSEIQKTTETDSLGFFTLTNLAFGKYTLVVYSTGNEKFEKEVQLKQPELHLMVKLNEIHKELTTFTIVSKKELNFGRVSLKSVENFGIYEGKKTEVIEMNEVTANVATNNARQVYAKITGLNIWESDGAGLQLGIGGRGLSPNRTANFNVRQNGYDISADALGYPESYYTPPLEAIERIELVRGASSLQFGTQFGGMLNFRFKKGNQDKPLEVMARQSAGSWGFYNAFTSVGGTTSKGKLNYYSFFQYKQGNGYRPNSHFNSYNGCASVNYKLNEKFQIDADLTKMNYLAKQPGGLTDRNFSDNPRQSLRERNWFDVDWNMASISFTYKLSEKTQVNTRNFGLFAHRNALGNLERINVIDFGGNRTLISGNFLNIGNETRLLHQYSIGKQTNTLLVGSRLYSGKTTTFQGDANDGSGPDFYFLNPDNLENSAYTFKNKNFSLFAENIFRISEKISITPGVRYEKIGTFAEGYFTQRVFDGAGNLIVQNKTEESMGRERSFVIFGVGTNYIVNDQTSLYANFTQNYRAINFSDIRVVNPNYTVDPNIKDETGFTADIGIKSNKENLFSTELTLFLVKYNDKIGQLLRADQPPLYLDYRFRGNISDARNMGVEFFGEINMIQLLNKTRQDLSWTFFINSAYVDARYINTEDNSIRDKKVEMVPPLMIRTGTQFKLKSFKASLQFSHISKHFTDATNAVLTATAVEGEIPSYQVVDLSLAYQYKRYGIEFTANNLFNQSYFTRRAEGYPGPGIIPADGRGFYITLSGRF
jgi:Fe(3+) dicitrate transport protein